MFGITNIRHNNTKVHVISKDNLIEHECTSPCECDDQGYEMTKVGAVSDTIWKIGCYKINPSTPSGNLKKRHFDAANLFLIKFQYYYPSLYLFNIF